MWIDESRGEAIPYAAYRKDLRSRHADGLLQQFQTSLAEKLRAALIARIAFRYRQRAYDIASLFDEIQADLRAAQSAQEAYLNFEQQAYRAAIERDVFQETSAFDQEIQTFDHVANEGDAATVTSKWTKLTALHTVLFDRYSEPGNALNFGERAEDVLRLLVDQAVTCAEKIDAIRLSVHNIWAYAIPDIDYAQTRNPLLDMDLAMRALSRELDGVAQREITFEFVLHGNQPLQLRNGKHTFIEGDPWVHATGFQNTEYLEFNLLDPQYNDILQGMESLRVLGVGASIALQSTSDISQRLYRTAVVVEAPDETVLDLGVPPVIVLNNVSVTDPKAPVEIVSPPFLVNRPARGLWKVLVSHNLGSPRANELLSRQNLGDVKLHLRLAGKPRPSPQWRNFTD